MKKFVAIYLGSAEGLAEWKATDDEKRKEREKAGMEGWMKWAKNNEASIVDLGSPLGKTKRINANGVSDSKNEITAYTILQAESHEAAAELFANHPHFMGSRSCPLYSTRAGRSEHTNTRRRVADRQ